MKEKTFERKTELLDAALQEFTSKSYEDASLNAIIKNAGISKGTFYYHFADKQALYLFLLESSANAKWDFINGRLAENPELLSGRDLFEGFKLQARLAAEFAIAHPLYHKLSRMFSREQGNPIYAAAKQRLGDESAERLGEMIDRAVAAGCFHERYSRDFIVEILSYLFTRFDEIFDAEEDFALDRMLSNLDSFVDFMRSGLGGGTQERSDGHI